MYCAWDHFLPPQVLVVLITNLDEVIIFIGFPYCTYNHTSAYFPLSLQRYHLTVQPQGFIPWLNPQAFSIILKSEFILCSWKPHRTIPCSPISFCLSWLLFAVQQSSFCDHIEGITIAVLGSSYLCLSLWKWHDSSPSRHEEVVQISPPWSCLTWWFSKWKIFFNPQFHCHDLFSLMEISQMCMHLGNCTCWCPSVWCNFHMVRVRYILTEIKWLFNKPSLASGRKWIPY
jgi:hypothetical protein